MVDSGSDISVLKANKVKPSQIYRPTNKCNVIGIGNGTTSTLGDTLVQIKIYNQNLAQNFHIVDENFPIPTDGILGRDFLAGWKCNIDYNTWILSIRTSANTLEIPITNHLRGKYFIPPRCEVLKRLHFGNIEDSVTLAQEIQHGVFCANGIISTNYPYVKIMNTLDETVQISNDFIPKLVPISNYEVFNINKSANNTHRKQALLNELKLNITDTKLKGKLENLFEEFSDVFALTDDELTENNFYKQTIHLNDPSPTYIKNYRIPEAQKHEMEIQVRNMLKNKIIQNSVSPYNNPILLVPKKSATGDKTWRLVVDFRQLNKKISPDKFPLPRIDEILDQLGRAKYFSTLDLKSGFHQIPLSEESKKYTAFSSNSGHYEFNRLPFGLNISPNSFQRMMTIALSGLPPETAFLYIDDIIVIGCSINHHIANLKEVFQRLRKYNLKLNPHKCNFFKADVTYLGHHISASGIQPDKNKYTAIMNFPVPTNTDETRRFVAFCNYYRRFIPNFAHITNPLNVLLRKDVPFQWSDACQQAFDSLKRSLLSPNILKFPDFRKEFILTTDASNVACGAVLAQLHDGVELPISFASKAFTKGESNKSTIEQELTAIHWAVQHFRPYLYGRKFKIRTDHRPLVYLFSMKEPSSKLTRMRLDLEEFDFEVEYIKGRSNVVSDALSRIQICTESLKQMYVVTRSIHKRQNSVTHPNVQSQKPDQLFVYETVSNEEAFVLPKLSFVHNIDNSLDIVIFNKNYTKGTAFGLKVQSNNDNINKIVTIQTIMKEIEKGAPKITNKRNNSYMLAIATSDLIFKYIDIQKFKQIGNDILRNTTILLFEKPRLLTSQEQVNNVLNKFHNSPTGGHLGINRLYRKVKSMYTWQNMKETISNYVKSCVECKLNKNFPSIKSKLVITSTPVKPFDVLSIDTVGPFSLTENGNRYAVTMQCDFTKFVIIVPIPDKSSYTIAKAVVQHCILNFGPMKSIKTDQGTEYKGVFDEICKLLNINHTCSTAYHPQTIGALERNHRCLNEYLRIFSNESKSDWDEWIPHYCFSYNTTPSADHEYTPFELIFGRKCNDIQFLATQKIDPLYNHDSYNHELRYRLQITHSKVLQKIVKSKTLRTNRMNENIKTTPINIGDLVFLKSENNYKLDQVHSGPYKIIKLTDSNATIQNDEKTVEVHKSRLLKL